MFAMGSSTIFACDVASVRVTALSILEGYKAEINQVDDDLPHNFGDTISGWWLLINRWNPFSNARSVSAITGIQSRLV